MRFVVLRPEQAGMLAAVADCATRAEAERFARADAKARPGVPHYIAQVLVSFVGEMSVTETPMIDSVWVDNVQLLGPVGKVPLGTPGF